MANRFPTLEEIKALVSFKQDRDEWVVNDVKGDVYGNVAGEVIGNISGSVGGDIAFGVGGTIGNVWADDESTDPSILELRARVEALEAQANHSPGATKMVPPPVATDEELGETWDKAPGDMMKRMRAIYNLGIKHGQASSREVADPAPVAGGLVERVAKRLAAVYETGPYSREASKAAILEVATWLREKGFFGAADLFKKEAGR